MPGDTPTDRPATDCTDSPTHPIRNMHDVLSSQCRRAICYYLQDRDEPTPVSAVVDQLAEWGIGPATPESQDDVLLRPREARAYRTHIREMASFGILEYDSESDVVRVPPSVTLSVSPPVSAVRTTDDRSMASETGRSGHRMHQ